MTGTAVKDFRVTNGDVTAEGDRAKRRYLRLIEELGAEEGAPEHGWKSRVARRLGIDQSFVSRLVRRDRTSIGADSIDKAVMHLRLRREYFYDAREPSTYRDYIVTRKEPIYEGWREFRASPMGRALSDAELGILTSIQLPEGYDPRAAFYEGVLYMVQNRITRADLERALHKAAELDERLRKKRRST